MHTACCFIQLKTKQAFASLETFCQSICLIFKSNKWIRAVRKSLWYQQPISFRWSDADNLTLTLQMFCKLIYNLCTDETRSIYWSWYFFTDSPVFLLKVQNYSKLLETKVSLIKRLYNDHFLWFLVIVSVLYSTSDKLKLRDWSEILPEESLNLQIQKLQQNFDSIDQNVKLCEIMIFFPIEIQYSI